MAEETGTELAERIEQVGPQAEAAASTLRAKSKVGEVIAAAAEGAREGRSAEAVGADVKEALDEK